MHSPPDIVEYWNTLIITGLCAVGVLCIVVQAYIFHSHK